MQTGAIADRAEEVSRQDLPAMDPESSIRKMVSKVRRKAYGESSPVCIVLERSAGENGTLLAGALLVFAVAGEYGGGGSLAAGRRVGMVVANGLFVSKLFLPIAIGDVLCGAFEADLDAVLLLF